MSSAQRPLLALTQGDPAGVGPEICLRAASRWLDEPRRASAYQPLLLIERAAVGSLVEVMPDARSRVAFIEQPADGADPATFRDQCTEVGASGLVPAIEPDHCEVDRLPVKFGEPSAADARGAMAAMQQASKLCLGGQVDAMVTAPVNKAVIALHVDPTFKGHTDTIADACVRYNRGRSLVYGRDYLMAFVSEGLNVALLSTHVPLVEAIRTLTTERVVDALVCLDGAIRKGGLGGRHIAVAGLNPHAGEGGLLGREDGAILVPAVDRARQFGLEVSGPESADTLFLRARNGEFDWVLALYHDQGLIPVKTLGFGGAVNWTAGLPLIRTSVDHGTAYDVAGRGEADPSGMFGAIDLAAQLAAERQS